MFVNSASDEKLPGQLEVKDAQLIFNSVWEQLENGFGVENLRFPKELILLGGAPGAGKGTNTDFIRKVRDITAEPIVVSSLLCTPEAEQIKASGGMVGDREVVFLVFRELLQPQHAGGAILDGFPRTTVQVECLKMLFDKMNWLRRRFANSPELIHFKQPRFHIMVLFVDENESVARQLKRGEQVRAHNEEVQRSGIGELREERATDFDAALAQRRYRVFKEQTYDALASLKQIFHFHFINAQARLEVVQDNILGELDYQSSLELDPRTFQTLQRLPVASDIVMHARRELVTRLDEYEHEQTALFHEVVAIIEEKFMPIVLRHAISGHANINSEAALFGDPEALAMLIDVFSERGYHATVDIRKEEVPVRFDLETGAIETKPKKIFRFAVRFKGSEIRRG
jgi:adenylate kinase